MDDDAIETNPLARELFGDRAAISTGELRVDAKLAREKLQKFRLPDPHLYVLHFVRAASVLGATRVDFDVDTTRMSCRFDASLSTERLADIWHVAFGERRSSEERAVHHLALGLGSAQALNPEQIVVRSGHATLTLGDEEEHFSVDDAGDDAEEAVDGVEISLQEKFRFGHLVEFFTTRFGDPGEVAALRRYCRFASMTITVDGEPLDAGVEWATSQAESIRVALDLDGARETRVHLLRDGLLVAVETFDLVGAGETHVHLVRDDLLVAVETFEPHGAPGRVVVENRDVRTDISGLSAVRDDVYREVIHGAPMGAYHEAVLEWAQHIDISARLRLATTFFRYYRQLVDDGLTPSAGTEALREWLETRPLFRSAVEAEGSEGVMLTPSQIVQDGLLRYATRPFTDPEIDLGAPVVLRRSQATTNSPGDVDGDRALFACARHAGAEPINVTGKLVRAERRLRKMRLWRSQEPRARPDSPFQARVEVDGMEGFAYVPVRSQRLDVHDQMVGVRIHLEEKILLYQPWNLPIGIDLRGSFTPNDAFDGVKVDESVKRLLAEVVAVVPSVMEAYARAVVDLDRRLLLRPHPIDQWLESVVEGDLLPHLLRLCFDDAEALSRDVGRTLDDIVRDTPNVFAIPDLLEAGVHGDEVDRVVDLLGAVADVETLQSFEGEWISLRTLFEHDDEVLVVDDTPASRHLLRKVDDELEGGIGRVILAHGPQRSILRHLAPHATDLRVALSTARSEQEFMARPLWRDTVPEHEVLAATEGSHDGNDFVVQLLAPSGEFGQAIFLRSDRFLARRAFAESGAGTVRAIVRCESLARPFAFDDTIEGEVYEELVDEIREAGSRLREEWFAKHRPTAMELVGLERRLYLRLAVNRFDEPEWRGEELIPIVEHPEGRRRLESPAVLAAAIEKMGGLLPYTTTGSLRADGVPPEVTVAIDVGAVNPTWVLRAIREDARPIDLSESDENAEAARYHFMKKNPPQAPIRGLIVDDFTFGDVEIEIGISPDLSYGPGPQVVRASVLYEDRLLEWIEVPVPIGSFKARVRSELITPDHDYDVVVGGRFEVLEALERAAAQMIRRACETVDAAARGDVGADLGPVRAKLIRMLERCREDEPAPPFDLKDLLESTRLFETDDGRWRSVRELEAERAGAERPEVEREEIEREKIEREEENDSHAPVADGPRGYDDHLLRRLTDLLVEARGDRIDLLEDHLAFSLHWSDDATDESVCEVARSGVTIFGRHPLVEALRDRPDDDGAVAWLASVVYSEINRHYETIVDPDEVAFQARFLASRVPD